MLSPGVFLDFFTKILHCNSRFSTCVAKCTCRNAVRYTSCAMCIFLFLKFCNLIKRIMLIYILFSKKPKTNVFTVLLLTCSNISNLTGFMYLCLSKLVSIVWKNRKRIALIFYIQCIRLEESQSHFPIHFWSFSLP